MTEPFVCDPIATGTSPDATAAAEPADDPPGEYSCECGFFVRAGFKNANSPAGGITGYQQDGHGISKMGIMCSKVTMPEKTFDVGLYRHYGAPYAYP